MNISKAELKDMTWEKLQQKQITAEIEDLPFGDLLMKADTYGISPEDVRVALNANSDKASLIKLIDGSVLQGKAYVQGKVLTADGGSIPEKGEKWGLIPLIYNDTLTAGDRPFSTNEDILGKGQQQKKYPCPSEAEECLPISFRIRTKVFDDKRLERYTEVNSFIRDMWYGMMEQLYPGVGAAGGAARYDCPITALSVLDLPIAEYIAVQTSLLQQAFQPSGEQLPLGKRGLKNYDIDSLYSSVYSDGNTMINTRPGRPNKSILPMKYISYLYRYYTAIKKNDDPQLGMIIDLFKAIPPYSGIIANLIHGSGAHTVVFARGKYAEAHKQWDATRDEKTCYLFDAQITGGPKAGSTKVARSSWNEGISNIITYLNSLGTKFICTPALRMKKDVTSSAAMEVEDGDRNEEDRLVYSMPFEFSNERDLLNCSGFTAAGVPTRKERSEGDMSDGLLAIPDMYGRPMGQNVGFHYGKLKQDKKKRKRPTKKKKPKKKGRRASRTKRR
jgi:hypothetical protein